MSGLLRENLNNMPDDKLTVTAKESDWRCLRIHIQFGFPHPARFGPGQLSLRTCVDHRELQLPGTDADYSIRSPSEFETDWRQTQQVKLGSRVLINVTRIIL